MNEPGQGRKSILTRDDHSIIKAKVQASPQHLKEVRAELQGELNKEFSTKTLTRFLKVWSGALATLAKESENQTRPGELCG